MRDVSIRLTDAAVDSPLADSILEKSYKVKLLFGVGLGKTSQGSD